MPAQVGESACISCEYVDVRQRHPHETSRYVQRLAKGCAHFKGFHLQTIQIRNTVESERISSLRYLKRLKSTYFIEHCHHKCFDVQKIT